MVISTRKSTISLCPHKRASDSGFKIYMALPLLNNQCCSTVYLENSKTCVFKSCWCQMSFLPLGSGQFSPLPNNQLCVTVPKKTLLNIVEARLKKVVELWCRCCIMMFRWISKQPGVQKFWNLCSHYQGIYDWISPLNKRSGSWFNLTQQSMGGNEYGKSGYLSLCTLFKHLMMLLKCFFFKASFYTLSKTLITCRDMQLRFF